MNKRRFLLGIILVFSLFISCMTPLYVYKVITDIYYSQESDFWCGAACIEMYECFKSTCMRNQSEIIDSCSYPLDIYANYKKNPGPDENSIPFADGSNGISDTLDYRIMIAADSIVAVWGTRELIGFNPGYEDQFEGAYACPPEVVTNMVSLRIPCPIDCGGDDYWIVPYMHRSGSYYVGEVMIKLSSDQTTFEGKGIVGFLITGSASVNQDQIIQNNKLTSRMGFITRQELHKLFPDCTFFPFWDLNQITGVPFIPFWYVQKPDGSRLIPNSWGNEMVRDANTGILYLKSHLQTSQNSVPEKPYLSQNYPNPFNAETQIYFTVKAFSGANLSVFNVQGQNVKTLVKGEYQPGEYRVTWDGTNQNGEKVSSGVYFYKLQVGSEMISKKMILTK